MKIIRTSLQTLASKAVLLGLIGLMTAMFTAESQAGLNDPFQFLYVFPGVRDDGQANFRGVATVVHCTNMSPAVEKVRFLVWQYDATLLSDITIQVGTFQHRTISTHGVQVFVSDNVLGSGAVDQGTFGVQSTSVNVVCTAQVVDATATVPNGINLHGVRFNPMAGTAE